jgi:ergothioneine biosynthesis protein EgtB
VLAYRDRARQALLPLLDDARLRETLPMVVEHELMHHETLLYMLQELPAAAKRAPAAAALDEPPAAARPARVRIPAGCVRLGAPRDGRFRWDNEHGPHTVDLPAFDIDALPVSNRDFHAFVEDGGYAEPRLWSDDGWRWVRRRNARAPHGWRASGDAWQVTTLFGEAAFDDAASWPACVTHCEARAYSAWRGARLPSEAEFRRAAHAGAGGDDGCEHPWGDDPPDARHANLGLTRWGPTPVGAHPTGASALGVHDLIGNAWEWTATPFRPFPGFEPLPRYPGYSADFFDERHFVLLGGSWATDTRLARRSFRNWFQPHYPYVFTQFRCVVSD